MRVPLGRKYTPLSYERTAVAPIESLGSAPRKILIQRLPNGGSMLSLVQGFKVQGSSRKLELVQDV